MRKRQIKVPRATEFDFFVKNPLTSYQGQYVAIVGKKVVASGSNAKEVWERATKNARGKLPLLAKVPKEEVLILVWK